MSIRGNAVQINNTRQNIDVSGWTCFSFRQMFHFAYLFAWKCFVRRGFLFDSGKHGIWHFIHSNKTWVFGAPFQNEFNRLIFSSHSGERYSLFLAFSFYTNGKKILSYTANKSDDTLHCLHGIRVISTQWVVLGHAYLFYAFLPIRNYAAIPEASDWNSIQLTRKCN